MVDDPLSADAWWQLHERIKDKAELSLLKVKEQQPLHMLLDVSYDALGKEHKAYFAKLAVLANNTAASLEMMSHLWGKEVGAVVVVL